MLLAASALDGGEWLASHSSTHWIGDWEGVTVGLYMVAERKIPAPTGNGNLVIQPVAFHSKR